MKKIAIITARGGSKRIPNKNIKFFLGKPIISYAIKIAINSNLFDEVMVSTDSKEIADISIKYGAKVPFLRSDINSNDFATTPDVIFEVINSYKKLNKKFDFGCCIYPTAPLITNEELVSALELLMYKKFDSVFPVIPFSYPIQRALKVTHENKVEMVNPKLYRTRSQDLETLYHDAGQFYWFNVDSVIRKKKLWTNNSAVIKINEIDSQDIDNEEDWKLAEIKYNLKFKNNE